MFRALVDTATIHATAATFERLKKRLRVRPINILSITAMVDAYVLFDKIIVDRSAWNYFTQYAPDDWVVNLESVVVPSNVKLPDVHEGLQEFLSSKVVFWLINALIKAEKDLGIRDHYMTYAGGDFGNFKEYGRWQPEVRKILKEKWKWDYNPGNAEHIDVVHASWRAMQYSKYCTVKGLAYYPHELRGRFLDALAALLGKQHETEAYIRRLMDKVRKIIDEDRKKQAKDNPELYPLKPLDILIWKSFKMPVLGALTFQKSKSIYDIFDKARDFRNKAKPLRKKCELFDRAVTSGRFEEVEHIYNDFVSVLQSFPWKDDICEIDWAVSVAGAPPSIGAEVGGKFKKQKAHLAFIRDIYSARSIPITFRDDILRIFDKGAADMGHWFKGGDA